MASLRNVMRPELLAPLVDRSDLTNSPPLFRILKVVCAQTRVTAACYTVYFHLDAAQVGIDTVRVRDVIVIYELSYTWLVVGR